MAGLMAEQNTYALKHRRKTFLVEDAAFNTLRLMS